MASAALGQIYLIPSLLDEEAPEVVPPYVLEAVKGCQAFFVENERSARRYLKGLWKEINIDGYEWHAIHKAEEQQKDAFRKLLQRGLTIGIISEAGCPGVADPGQILVEAAQEMGAVVKPLVGPSSILLALMASGMNGQQFHFHGYIPIDTAERVKALKDMEAASAKNQSTHIFIETPYRNNQLIELIAKTCLPTTRLCVAADLTGKQETIRTHPVSAWKGTPPDYHKRPAIFLLQAGAKKFVF